MSWSLDTLIRKGGTQVAAAAAEVVRLVHSDPQYALLRTKTDQSWLMKDLARPTGLPDETAKLKRIMKEAAQQVRG